VSRQSPIPTERTVTTARSRDVKRPRTTVSNPRALKRPPRSVRTNDVDPQATGYGNSRQAIGNDTRRTVRARAGPVTSKPTRG
jgi:hypothetical protein